MKKEAKKSRLLKNSLKSTCCSANDDIKSVRILNASAFADFHKKNQFTLPHAQRRASLPLSELRTLNSKLRTKMPFAF